MHVVERSPLGHLLKFGGVAAYGRPLQITKAQTISAGDSGMTCQKQPAGSGQRYICN
eukprot:COSAG06_NODE_2163_length_7438_cov_2.447200_5_plen_57_part_00